MAAHAQDTLSFRQLTLEDVYKLALANSYQLKITEKATRDAQQQVEIFKSNRLPALSSDLLYGYISNAENWNPSFGDHTTVAIPHHFTAFSAQASEVIFQGGQVQNTIKKSALQEQIAALSNERNVEDIKLLVSAKYLDIYRLISQQKIYRNNIRLTQNRLKNVLTMQRQGMVTQNDVLRTELTISDLQLALRTTTNDILIINKQLNVVTGLPDSVSLLPDSNLLRNQHEEKRLDDYLSEAVASNQDLKISAVNNRIAETNIELLGSDRLPQLFLYAKSDLDRPYTYSVPTIDIYTNVWQAGIGLHYNISSTYQARKRIKSGEIELEQSHDRETLEKQNLAVGVKSDFIKYNEAKEDLVTLTADRKSAEENYRVVEKKYFNQLALLTDMIDATNTKIEAELKVTTAQINVVYTYCQLLHTIGTL
ncbi:MAG: TolC family protein [Bacteroidota bacterium]|nr:TolC family protein [Bacteroidota bacterium]